MKYEYLKGSEKDFEGAPEWAMVAIRCPGFDNIDFSTSLKNGERCYYGNEKREYFITNSEAWLLIAERRQITEPSWDGVGLPPVGCECEYIKSSLKEWTACVIDYVGSSFIVYRDCYGVELTGIICDIQFRPLRSEADKKRDAAIKAIDDWLPEYTTDTPSLYHATAMYAAIEAGSIPGVKLED